MCSFGSMIDFSGLACQHGACGYNVVVKQEISVSTRSRTDLIDVTRLVAESVSRMGLREGVVTVFVPHTTAGITINEHADPNVVGDLMNTLDRLVPWSARYRHSEGNAAAHIKASLMGSSVQVIVSSGRLQMGRWQGIFLCEFDGPRERRIWIEGTAA